MERSRRTTHTKLGRPILKLDRGRVAAVRCYRPCKVEPLGPNLCMQATALRYVPHLMHTVRALHPYLLFAKEEFRKTFAMNYRTLRLILTSGEVNPVFGNSESLFTKCSTI